MLLIWGFIIIFFCSCNTWFFPFPYTFTCIWKHIHVRARQAIELKQRISISMVQINKRKHELKCTNMHKYCVLTSSRVCSIKCDKGQDLFFTVFGLWGSWSSSLRSALQTDVNWGGTGPWGRGPQETADKFLGCVDEGEGTAQHRHHGATTRGR